MTTDRWDDNDLGYRIRQGLEVPKPLPPALRPLRPGYVGIVRALHPIYEDTEHLRRVAGQQWGPPRLVASVETRETMRHPAGEVGRSMFTDQPVDYEKQNEHRLWALNPYTGGWEQHPWIGDDRLDMIAQWPADRRIGSRTNKRMWAEAVDAIHARPVSAAGIGWSNQTAATEWNEFAGRPWLTPATVQAANVFALPHPQLMPGTVQMEHVVGVLFPLMAHADRFGHHAAGFPATTDLIGG